MRKLLSYIMLAVMAVAIALPLNARQAGAPQKRSAKTPAAVSGGIRSEATAVRQKGNGFRMLKTKAAAGRKPSGLFGMKSFAGSFLKMRTRNNAPRRVAGSTPLIGGIVFSGDNTVAEGIYSIPTDGSSSYTLLQEDVSPTRGGVLVDGKYYATNVVEIFGIDIVLHDVYDATTWELLYEVQGDYTSIASDMAYDATTDKVYGCFFNENLDGMVFGTLDLNTFTRTAICPLSDPWNGVAVDKDGVLYAICSDGRLYTVDKTSGATTLVGSTGLVTQYLTSAAIDQKTGRFYYCPNTDTFSGLYEINPKTAEATLIVEYPNGDEFGGLCVPDSSPEDGAPAAVENLKAEFAGSSLSGTLTFDAPATTFGGDAGQGELTYKVLANGESVATGKTAFGEKAVAVPVTVAGAGSYKFIVTVTNSVGDSPKSSVSLWVGDDVPSSVTGVSLAYTAGNMNLKWTAVTTSPNGGYFDPAGVTYTVTRYPDNEVVARDITATSFTEPVAEPENFKVYYYTVSAKYKNAESVPTASNKVTIGNIRPPYLNDFGAETSLDGYTMLNLNDDGQTWVLYGGIVYMPYNRELDMNSWLITPGIRLEAGKLYTISFDASSADPRYTERVEAFIGTSATVAGMTRQIVDKTELVSDGLVTLKANVTVETTGIYYLGIHGCSDADMYDLVIDNIAISAGSSTGAPAAPADLKVTPAADGVLSATVTFTAPDKTIGGEALSSLSEIELRRDGEPLNTFTAPTPGAALSYTDATAAEGSHVYSVVASNEAGAGLVAEAKVYVGINIPAGPGLASVVETANAGEVTISWDATDTDIDGNPLDPAAVTYIILDAEGSVVAENVTGTSYTYQAVPAGAQEFVRYAVFAATRSGANENEYSLTQMIPVGTPYSIPVAESFAGGEVVNDYIWGVSSPDGSSAQWQLFTDESGVASQDGDNGFIGSAGTYKGETALLFSGKLAVGDQANPALVFYYYKFENGANTIAAQINAGNGFETVATFEAGQEEGWTKAIVPLAAYKGKIIQFGFLTTIVNYKATIIDNVKVIDVLDHNLAATAISVPGKMNPNVESTITVSIENAGSAKAEGYTVELYRNGALAQTVPGEAVESGSVVTVEFKETPTVASGESLEYYAVVSYAADQDNSDNTTGKAVATVVMPKYPAVSDLAGSQTAAGVELKWSEPDISNLVAEPVTDTFESYESFAINTAGDWSFVDGDGAATYGFESLPFPGSGQPMAYIVFDSSDASFNYTFDAHSGNKYMASFASMGGIQNNNWMISPELDGSAQTVSFFAKTYTTDYGNESFEFYYSATGNDVADFIKVGGDDAVPGEWTEYSYDVPAGAKYFAIRCISNDCFIFLVDDVTYIPADAVSDLALVGYNVYRDGERISAEPVAAPSYTDAATLSGEHSYFVTVVYDKGESKPSNIVTVGGSTGIDMATVGNTAKVTSSGRTIIVTGAAGRKVTVCTADGKTVYNGEGAAITRVRVSGGLYIVKVDNDIVKTVVR